MGLDLEVQLKLKFFYMTVCLVVVRSSSVCFLFHVACVPRYIHVHTREYGVHVYMSRG